MDRTKIIQNAKRDLIARRAELFAELEALKEWENPALVAEFYAMGDADMMNAIVNSTEERTKAIQYDTAEKTIERYAETLESDLIYLTPKEQLGRSLVSPAGFHPEDGIFMAE